MPLSPADRIEIHELYARYAVHFDGGDEHAWARVFSEDGRFLIDGQPDVVGRDALAAFARKRISQAPGIRHFTTNVVVDEGPEGGAVGQAYALVLCKRPGEPMRLRTLGDYADVLVRGDDGWRFASRRYTPWILPDEGGRAFAFESLVTS